MLGEYVFEAGERLTAGMFVTPDSEGRIFQARPGDAFVGRMGILDDLEPGDHVRFPAPRGGLGRKLRDMRGAP